MRHHSLQSTVTLVRRSHNAIQCKNGHCRRFEQRSEIHPNFLVPLCVSSCSLFLFLPFVVVACVSFFVVCFVVEKRCHPKAANTTPPQHGHTHADSTHWTASAREGARGGGDLRWNTRRVCGCVCVCVWFARCVLGWVCVVSVWIGHMYNTSTQLQTVARCLRRPTTTETDNTDNKRGGTKTQRGETKDAY